MFDTDNNKLSELSDSQKTKLAGLVSSRWRNATTQIRPLIEESTEAWNYYTKNTPDVKNEEDRRGLRLGLIPRAVDSVLAILHNANFPADEQFFKGTPKNQVAVEYQDLYERYKVDNFAESNVTEDFRKYFLSLALDPAAAIAVHWRSKKKKKITYVAKRSLNLFGVKIDLPVMGLKEKVENDYICWEGTVADVLDFNDWRVDPDARSVEDSWFIRRWYEPTWKVKENYDVSGIDVLPYGATCAEDYDRRQKLSDYGLIQPIEPDSESDGAANALLMCCYDDFEIDGKVYKNHVVLTLNGIDPVWFGPNDYNHGRKPYIVHSLNPLPNQIYGLSLIKHSLPSAEAIDNFVQSSLRVAAFSAFPIFEVDVQEPAFRGKRRDVEPGMTIPVKRKGAVSQVPVNIANMSFIDGLVKICMDNIRELTGASPMFTGEDFANSPANITAFQVDQHVQGAHTRFQAMLSNFNNCVLEPFLIMSHENDKQFKEKSEWIDIGTEYKELTPDIIKQTEFKWLVTSTQANLAKAKKVATLKELAFNILPQLVQGGVVQLSPQQIVIDQGVILKDLFVTGGLTNTDEIMKVMDMSQQGFGGLDGLSEVLGAESGGAGQVPTAAPEGGQIPVPNEQGAGQPGAY